MPRRSPEKPKIERGEEKERKEKLSEEEQVRLLTEVYFSEVQKRHGEPLDKKGGEAKERTLNAFRKEFEQNLETHYQPLLQESKLSRDQFQFLTNALAEINRREQLQDLSKELLIGNYDPSRVKMSAFSERLKRFEELMEESKKAEVEFTIPGKKESNYLDFGLRGVEDWRNALTNFEDSKMSQDRANKEGWEKELRDYTEKNFEEKRKEFQGRDQSLKEMIEEFEREKASAATSPKEEIPGEELGKAREEVEKRFEEPGPEGEE